MQNLNLQAPRREVRERLLLFILLLLGVLDGAVQIGLISCLLHYLYERDRHVVAATSNAQMYNLSKRPRNIDMVHTYASLVAATIFVIPVGLGGFVIKSDRFRRVRGSRTLRLLDGTWLIATAANALLNLIALLHTFIVNNRKRMDVDLEITLGAEDDLYPLGSWTPYTWLNALRSLPVQGDSDLWKHHQLSVASHWNLITLFSLALSIAVVGGLQACRAKSATTCSAFYQSRRGRADAQEKLRGVS